MENLIKTIEWFVVKHEIILMSRKDQHVIQKETVIKTETSVIFNIEFFH